MAEVALATVPPINLTQNTDGKQVHSVPARLIGEQVEARIGTEEIKAGYGGDLVQRMPPKTVVTVLGGLSPNPGLVVAATIFIEKKVNSRVLICPHEGKRCGWLFAVCLCD